MKFLHVASTVLLFTGVAAAEDRLVEANSAAVRDAVEKSLPYLASDGRAWMDGKVGMQDGKKCVSCHYVSFGVWSHKVAALAGVHIDNAANEKLSDDAMQFIADPKKGRLVTYSHLMMANPRPTAKQKEVFQGFARTIVGLQEPAGYWQAKGQFPSQERKVMESNAVATMWALTAMRPYAKDDSVSASHQKALKWLKQSKPGVSTEWHAWRLIVSHTERLDDVPTRTNALIERQKIDGGWSWLSSNPSDAYTTGQVLYALVSTGTRVDHPVIQRGMQFLLKSQRPDGTWNVPSKLVSAGPDENKDQIYTYWGTAWATIALARTEQTRLTAR